LWSGPITDATQKFADPVQASVDYSLQHRAALKLQAVWLLSRSRELRREGTREDAYLSSLVPALFTPPSRLRKSVLGEKSFVKSTFAAPTILKHTSFARTNTNVSSPAVLRRMSQISQTSFKIHDEPSERQQLEPVGEARAELIAEKVNSAITKAMSDAMGSALAKLECDLASRIDYVASDAQAIRESVADISQKVSQIEQAIAKIAA